MCHAEEKWTDALPLVLLGICHAYKEELQSTAAEFVYGEPLRVPGDFLVPAAQRLEASTFIEQLRRHMDQLRPTSAARHDSTDTFIRKDLKDSNYVFLRQDYIRRALEPPYTGPHKVIARTDKSLTTLVFVGGNNRGQSTKSIQTGPEFQKNFCIEDGSLVRHSTMLIHKY